MFVQLAISVITSETIALASFCFENQLFFQVIMEVAVTKKSPQQCLFTRNSH